MRNAIVRRPGPRAVAILAACAIGGGGVFAAASLSADPSGAVSGPPTIDSAHPIATSTIGGTRLTLAPQVGSGGAGLCFRAEVPSGAATMGCGKAADVTAQGAILSGEQDGVRTVWGFAPKGTTQVKLGTRTLAPDARGFYTVSGPSTAPLSVRAGEQVTFSTSFAQPAGPSPGQ